MRGHGRHQPSEGGSAPFRPAPRLLPRPLGLVSTVFALKPEVHAFTEQILLSAHCVSGAALGSGDSLVNNQCRPLQSAQDKARCLPTGHRSARSPARGPVLSC